MLQLHQHSRFSSSFFWRQTRSNIIYQKWVAMWCVSEKHLNIKSERDFSCSTLMYLPRLIGAPSLQKDLSINTKWGQYHSWFYQGMYKNRVNIARTRKSRVVGKINIIYINLNFPTPDFLVCMIKEPEFQNYFCRSLPCGLRL